MTKKKTNQTRKFNRFAYCISLTPTETSELDTRATQLRYGVCSKKVRNDYAMYEMWKRND